MPCKDMEDMSLKQKLDFLREHKEWKNQTKVSGYYLEIDAIQFVIKCAF